jgi:hypothetical protein
MLGIKHNEQQECAMNQNAISAEACFKSLRLRIKINIATEQSYGMACSLVDFFLMSHPLMPMHFAVAMMTAMKESYDDDDENGETQFHHHMLSFSKR